MYYDELPSDTVGARLGGSILNAVIVVCGIAAMTFMLVLCFYYRLYKVKKKKKKKEGGRGRQLVVVADTIFGLLISQGT
jgi:hypothetical protein